MSLLKRRYLCVFCACFLFAAFFVKDLSVLWTGIILGTAIAVGIAILPFAVVNKGHRFKLIVAMLCAGSVFLGTFVSMCAVVLPRERVERYAGEKTVLVKILDVEYSEEESETYLVRIQRINDDNVSIKGYLCIDGKHGFDYGDRIIANMNVYFEKEEAVDVLLTLVPLGESKVYIDEADSKSFLSLDGIKGISKKLQNAFCDYVDRLYDSESRGLVKGFLINEKEDIRPETQIAFKRSGTSHLLAVSGLHITLLLGSLEVLLRKLFLPKAVRCSIVAVVGIFFIALTDFSPSAVRSLLMLFAVYLSFLFSEENDSMTALFAAVTLIVLVSPTAVYDIGMWMSFFATLGLVGFYPYVESKLPKKKPKRMINRILFSFGMYIVKGVLITLVANFFLLPIFWLYFGEISLAAVPANLIMSPMSSLYMPLCAVSLIVGKIPFVGSVVCFAVKWIGVMITQAAKFFASMPYAVLSLKYPFAGILIIAFTVSFTVLLLVTVKKKWLVFIPPVAFVLSFAICLGVFNLCAKETLEKYTVQDDELWIYSEAESTAVLDMSDGRMLSLYTLLTALPENATEIDAYVIEKVENAHPAMLERLQNRAFIRKIYLPKSKNSRELENIEKIYENAELYGSEIVFYDDGAEKQIFMSACRN